jgi:hypothetical protein
VCGLLSGRMFQASEFPVVHDCQQKLSVLIHPEPAEAGRSIDLGMAFLEEPGAGRRLHAPRAHSIADSYLVVGQGRPSAIRWKVSMLRPPKATTANPSLASMVRRQSPAFGLLGNVA